MSPRSILKPASVSSTSHSVHHACKSPAFAAALPYPNPSVHFPPTPTLTQTFPTHSVTAYDRAPIVVLPNDCALPERGCPGRTYEVLEPSADTTKHVEGSYFHPRALEAGQANSRQSSNRSTCPPPLVPDLSSSESDESDGLVSPPPEMNCATPIPLHFPRDPHSLPVAKAQLDKALAFLPHPPAPMKDREKKRRNPSPVQKFKSESGTNSFAASSLDGCLGGF